MYQKILVPVDGSELAECVLPHVEAIAKGCQVKNIIFVQAVEIFHPADGMGFAFSPEEMNRLESEGRKAAKEYLSRLLARVKYGGANVQSEILVGRPADRISEYAEKNGIDLIVMATHGRSGVSRWVWGSAADRILRSSCVPVLMVRAPGCVPGM